MDTLSSIIIIVINLNYMWTSIGPVFFQAVSLHVAFLTESKAADFTLKRLFPGMNSMMSNERKGRRELSEAIFTRMGCCSKSCVLLSTTLQPLLFIHLEKDSVRYSYIFFEFCAIYFCIV
jgi:hypothetical protein